MTMKTLLLGAAAGLVTVGAAQAADLPMTKAEAVEYVKVCSTFGEGFFYIPGTDTCLRVSGEIRADYLFNTGSGGNQVTRSTNVVDFSTQGRVKFDARTATEYGTLRSFFQINATANNGSFGFSVDKAFIQLGGLTAGFAHTFFGIYDNDFGDTIFAGYFTSQSTVNLLAYTAVFGGGFSATLSVEDSIEHRGVLINDTTDAVAGFGGSTMPDFVGNLRVDQSWGEAAVFGAVHQIRYPLAKDDADYGFAIGAAAAYNLPFAGGAHIVLEGVYADGADNYLGAGGVTGDAGFTGNLASNNTDKHRGFSLTGEIGANVTPALTLVAFGSYLNITNTLDPDNDGAGSAFQDKLKAYIFGANATYTVVKGLTVGAEVSYTKLDYNVFNASDSDGVGGGIRIKRTF